MLSYSDINEGSYTRKDEVFFDKQANQIKVDKIRRNKKNPTKYFDYQGDINDLMSGYLKLRNINFNVNISAILRKKTEAEIVEILRELITELKDLKNLGKLESFEKKLLNKFDESSYSELLKLKTQLNRE